MRMKEQNNQNKKKNIQLKPNTLDTLRLIQRSNPSKLVQQVWYADDGIAAGSLTNLLTDGKILLTLVPYSDTTLKQQNPSFQ